MVMPGACPGGLVVTVTGGLPLGTGRPFAGAGRALAGLAGALLPQKGSDEVAELGRTVRAVPPIRSPAANVAVMAGRRRMVTSRSCGEPAVLDWNHHAPTGF